MKTTFWKLLIACIVLIAIPIQGFAGAVAVVCEGSHQALYGVADSSAFDESHVRAAIEPVSQKMVALADQNEHLSSKEVAHLKCSACGPCCVGTALISSSEPFVAPFDGKCNFPEFSSHHLSPTLAGLDRPPQSSHA
ncbi:MAG: hypothetical protein KGN32_11500 [Burkholderiales bacterium]|nr:hypothetical protein [Burkholderiales bacterium]